MPRSSMMWGSGSHPPRSRARGSEQCRPGWKPATHAVSWTASFMRARRPGPGATTRGAGTPSSSPCGDITADPATGGYWLARADGHVVEVEAPAPGSDRRRVARSGLRNRLPAAGSRSPAPSGATLRSGFGHGELRRLGCGLAGPVGEDGSVLPAALSDEQSGGRVGGRGGLGDHRPRLALVRR